jgi:nitroreductase
MQDYTKNLLWRYATKKFDTSKKLSEEQVELLKNAARLAPSSFGLQPWKFYLVSNPEVRAEIRKVGYDQAQITDASHVFVIAARVGFNENDVTTFVEDISKTRNMPLEALEGYKQMMNGSVAQKANDGSLDAWCARQAYIALGFILSAAAQNGIDACPMEGFDASAVEKILGIREEGYAAYALCPVGFRSSEDEQASWPKVRFEMNKVVKEIK